MESPTVPSKERELEIFRPLSPLVWEAFEGAAEDAAQFFESREKPFSETLFAGLVRWYVGISLQDKGKVIEGLDREALSNDGLCIVHHQRRIRMWKSDDGVLPPPGPSQVKQEFYNQQLAQQLSFFEDRSLELNLAILWSVGANHRLKGLYLSCPKWASSDGLNATDWWTEPLEHPATIVAAVETNEKVRDEDLPIGLAVEESRKADQPQ